jgi:hypothetical protein
MTDTFRALCAELVATWDKDYPWDHVDDPDIMGALLDRARIALAQPEPVLTRPKCFNFAMDFLGGTEEVEVRNYIERLESAASAAQPEPEPEGPTDEELYELWEQEGYEGDFQDCRRFYRGAIARWGRSTPQPPAELAEMVKRLHEINNPTPQPVAEGLTNQELLRCAKIATPCYDLKIWERELRIMRAAIAADRARFGRPTPQPVPVSERLPGPEDCDEEGRCWVFDPCDRGWWCYREALPSDGDPDPSIHTHWLPHWALPMPAPANPTSEEI